MQIKRDYSQPFFTSRRDKSSQRRSLLVRLVLIAIILIAGLVLAAAWQVDKLEGVVLSVIGAAPTPTPQPSQLATRASQLYQQGLLQEAADLYAQAVQERPDNIDYLYEYGMVLIDLDLPTRSASIADHIIDLAPNDVRGPTLKAISLIWEGQSSAAIPVARAGMEIDPSFAPLNAVLSRAYINSGNLAEGYQYGERSVELDPFDVAARRSFAYALTAVAEPELAIEQLLQAIDLLPTYTPPYFELARLYLDTNRDQEAIATYDLILAMQPRNARAMLRQCQAYRKIGEFERALGFCADSVREDPAYAPAQFQLGMLYYRSREFVNSKTAFQGCVDNDPGNYECSYRLALSSYYLGDCDTGWRLLQNSLIMAQSQSAPEETINNIRQGLSAITTDAACPAFAGRDEALPTPDPAGG